MSFRFLNEGGNPQRKNLNSETLIHSSVQVTPAHSPTKINNKKEKRTAVQPDTGTKFQSMYKISKAMTTGLRNLWLKIKQLLSTYTHT